MNQGRVRWILALAMLLILGALSSPWLIRGYWSIRSNNAVRRGVTRAEQLGCFTCHGLMGLEGIPDPGWEGGETPAWGGGVWMMYVASDDEIREFILDGVSTQRAMSMTAQQERAMAVVHMPAYRDELAGSDLDDVVAAFRVLSGMSRPQTDTLEWRGWKIARRWKCFACHGPAAAGGVSNPGSFAGFIPGWYGPDFDDLVRDRTEFDAWIRDGEIGRLERSRLASYFTRRQRTQMPPYANLTDEELDELWAYSRWLAETGGSG